jgi:Arc/MetJ-type ribon-helix-helix transcriptional regulator
MVPVLYPDSSDEGNNKLELLLGRWKWREERDNAAKRKQRYAKEKSEFYQLERDFFAMAIS